MYLKSTETQGFKPFANKMPFELHNGITGIAGPNGSGEGSMAGVIRQVLGGQRIRQLCEASMQDVIFSGMEARKPQGFTYVTIIPDNSDHQLSIDYDEVTVSRRIYRSGEGEHTTNGSARRLKDINELFYNTGIGRGGYSIIGQGQTDKILSGKPEEWWELFDRAADIMRLKRRKNIAQKKPEDEKQSLIRVSDILSELEKQAGPLTRWLEAVREYLRLEEELETYEVSLFLLESGGIKSQLEEMSGKGEIASGGLGNTKAASGKIKTDYGSLDEVLSALGSQTGENGGRVNQTNTPEGNLEGQINVLREQINTEKMNAEYINVGIQPIEEWIEEKKAQILRYETGNSEIVDLTKGGARHQEEAEQALREKEEYIMFLDEKMETVKGSIINTLNKKASLAARQQHYETMLEQVQVRHSEVYQKLLESKSDESAQEEQLKVEQVRLAEVGGRLNSLQLSQGEGKQRCRKLDQKARCLTRNLNEKEQEYRTDYTRLDSLKNVIEHYEGYGSNIRRVMEVKDRVRGIHGAVADLVTTQKEYETAIETALDGSIQDIVINSEQTARQLTERLKRNEYRRATFLSLTSMGQKGGFAQEKTLKKPGVIGLANDLVQVDDAYRGLTYHLPGRVMAVDKVDNAIALARKLQYSLRVVTLEGKLLSAEGPTTDGAFKNNSNLLGRKREVEELEERCEKALKATGKLKTDLELNKSPLAKKREELEAIRMEQQKAYLEQNAIRMNISQLGDKVMGVSESVEDLVLENQQLGEQIRGIVGSRDGLLSDTEGLETTSDKVNQGVGALGCRMETTRAEREGMTHQLSAIQMETANLQQRCSFVLENMARINEEIRKLKEEAKGLVGGTSDTQTTIDGRDREIIRLRELIDNAMYRMEEARTRLGEATDRKEEKSGEQKGLFEKRGELSNRMNQLNRELFRSQNQKEKLEEKLEIHINYMWSGYELTFTTAGALRNLGLTILPDIKKKIDGLKSGIKGLGSANVNAIEDCKKVSERCKFMKAQYDDLIQAEKTLLEIIEELDTGIRRQFGEEFLEIKTEFDKVLRELFGGGHGTLELVRGGDILEAGVQIISQPPGKELWNMMQLSGGEKALMAVTLLFAIQNLKPFPFCLLDEIEAASDDSDMDRFAEYLRKLTKNTQLIIITHRRGTMVAANRPYGITMQEKGVSVPVSVNLIEDALNK